MKQNSKKRIVPMLFALLVVLTLVSCCFLGSTFARYTSTSTGTATAGIAKWEIDFNGNDGSTNEAADVTFDKISPDDAAWAEGLDRVHASEGVLVATIVNRSEVAADISISLSNTPVFYGTEGNVFEGWNSEGGITAGGPSASYAEAYNTIRIQFAYDLTGNGPDQDTTWYNYNATVTVRDIIPTDGAVYVYARVIWDTQDGLGQVNSDKLDTYLGQNITSVSCEISYVAVQSSELPA